MVTGSSGRAKWEIVASGCFYDPPDCVHDVRGFVDRHNVNGLFER